MEHKNKSFSRIKRHQSDKVLRYSIRKYSFGAASVAVAALMFLGTHAVSADVIDDKNQLVIGALNPNEEGSPLVVPGKTEKNEETKETEKVEVAKESEKREKPSENPETVETNSLNNGTSTSAIAVAKDASADKVTEKQTLDKSQLQASITKVQELLDKVNKEKAPASTLAAIQADLENAKNALNNNGLTQAEIDAIAKKLNEKIFVLSSMPKLGAPEKVVKEGKNTIANTGSRDSRNGQSMGEGTQFRTDGVHVEGALDNVKEYISEPAGHGSTVEGNRPQTIAKTFMTAKYSQENGMNFITYDVYFQNDGKALDGIYKNSFWFYPPRDLLYTGGNYPVGVVSDAYYERYKKKEGATGTLSENPNNFTREGERYTVPLEALNVGNNFQDYSSQNLWRDAGGIYQLSGGPTRDGQRQQMLKQLEHNEDLNRIIKLNNDPNGPYPKPSYSHLLTVGSEQNYAYKYHVKMRLKDNITDAQARTAGTIAVTAKEGYATTALAAYVYAATGTRLVSTPDAQIDPIQGLTVTKTVGDPLGNLDEPANSGYVIHKEGKPFPGGVTWSWQNGVKPSTDTAGVFKYKVIATYQDNTSSEDAGSGSDGTVTLKVKPKQPVIEQNSVNEKAGKTGQNVVVTVQDGVPDGSTVILYNGDAVIGRGTTSGRTATINVSGALPSTGITAKTTVTSNNETVESALSAPVIPTKVPDSAVPTVTKEGQDGNTGEVTYKVTTPTGGNYPEGSKVTINGKEYDVDGEGKVKVPNKDLPADKIPASPTKAQETGKLPKDGNTVEVPAKLVDSAVPTVTKEGQDGNTGEVTYKVTTPTGDKYPNADQVETKTTVGNGAKSNDSQNVLPNTGTESNATLASLGLLGLLSGFGLVARKKKED